MVKLTTIPVRPEVRDRLRSFGTAGMNYSEVITKVLDRIEMQDFVAQIRREVDDPSVEWVDHKDLKWD